MRKSLLTFIFFIISLLPLSASDIFIEAESFSTKGGWVIDQQFMDNMGSPYLLAHGYGVPVEDASTTFSVKSKGGYNVFVRTYNWTSPWSRKEGPGKFKIQIGNQLLEKELGCTGDKWEWQLAGKVYLNKGDNLLTLKDLTGFDGRCDAIYLTKGMTPPPSDIQTLALFRKKKLNLPEPRNLDFDFVVIGGGISGMCAAVAAARQGLKVALVNDRPVLGGNNSSEVRVHLGGTIEVGPYPALGRMIREFGHSKEGNAKPASNYEDDKKQRFIEGEKNVTLFECFRAVAVNMKDKSNIGSVLIKSIEDSREIVLHSPLFSDCTGDGTIGALAGADFMIGREAASEFGESLAPEKADTLVMGASLQWYSAKEDHRTTFPDFDYGLNFNEQSAQKVAMGEWTWETGMRHDMISQAEFIRDYGLLVVYSNWSYLKNKYSRKAEYDNRRLDWVAFIAGKRESRRLIGDYIYKQDDIDKNVFHEDATFTTTWSIDLHFPDPENTKHFPGEEFKSKTVHNKIYPSAVPYRCLYSRNIDNLFMAGRDISVTHVALGTTRVMRTCGMAGEVVGLAASVCKKHEAKPRDVYRHYLGDLKELMQKGAALDCELPDNQNFNLQKPLPAPKYIRNN